MMALTYQYNAKRKDTRFLVFATSATFLILGVCGLYPACAQYFRRTPVRFWSMSRTMAVHHSVQFATRARVAGSGGPIWFQGRKLDQLISLLEVDEAKPARTHPGLGPDMEMQFYRGEQKIQKIYMCQSKRFLFGRDGPWKDCYSLTAETKLKIYLSDSGVRFPECWVED